MKKIIAILCAVILFSGINLHAAPVSSSRAMEIAKKIFAAQPATKAGSAALKIVWDGEDVATKAAQPAFYVIARDGGGFVIIAGDDNVQPVLAISDHNEFKVEGMPENVRWWMDRMKAYVRDVKTQTPEVKAQWVNLVATKNASVPEAEVTVLRSRLTPEWNQYDPYNGACPLVGSDRTITGCVALAISEILYYQANHATEMGITMPVKGTGNVGGYTPRAGYVAPATYDLNTHSYDWESIASFDEATATVAQKEQLATLIADLGAIVEAEYSVSSTSAISHYVAVHMAEHFYFNKAATTEYAASYTSRNWINKLKAEIDQRPLFYFGQSSVGGHAFIFDGYGTYLTNDVFHVNFGWGGYNNGYYYYTNLDTSTSDDGSEDWSGEAAAIFGFYPDANSTYPVSIGFVRGKLDGVDHYGISSLDGVHYGDLSQLYIGGIRNDGNAPYAGTIKLVKESNDGSYMNVLTIATFTTENPLPPGYYIWYDPGVFIGGSQFEFGEHLSVYYSTDAGGTVWEKVPGDEDGYIVADLPVFPAAFIKAESSYQKDDWFVFRLMNNDYLYAGTEWTFTDPDGNKTVKNQSEREFQLTKKGVWKIEAAVATDGGGPVIETLVTYIKVK